VTFSAAGTTGSNTLNVSGLGAKALMQYDLNGALVAAVITSGLIAVCQYNGTYWVVLDALPSSTISSTQQTLVANEGAVANPVPIFKAGVLSALKNTNLITHTAGGTFSTLVAANFLNTLVIPANFFVPGKTVKVDMFLAEAITTAGNLTIYGSVGLANYLYAVVALPTGASNIKVELWLTCLTAGSSGVASFEAAMFTFVTFGSGLPTFTSSILKITSGISTLVPNTIDLPLYTPAAIGTSLVSVAAVSVIG
jgi:hypothetical protein